VKRVALSGRRVAELLRNEKVLTLFPTLRQMAAKRPARRGCGSCQRADTAAVNQAREFITGLQPSQMAALKAAINMAPSDRFYVFRRDGRKIVNQEL